MNIDINKDNNFECIIVIYSIMKTIVIIKYCFYCDYKQILYAKMFIYLPTFLKKITKYFKKLYIYGTI